MQKLCSPRSRLAGKSRQNVLFACREDVGGVEVRLHSAVSDFFLLQKVQNGSGAHTASYSVGTDGYLPQAQRSWDMNGGWYEVV